MTASDRLTPEQVRTLFLFEALDDSQLAWLAERGRVEQREGGSAVYNEGEPATCFFVLLSGAVTLSRRLHGDDIEVSRTDRRGVYGGATQAYLGDRVAQVYPNTLRAVSDAEFFVLLLPTSSPTRYAAGSRWPSICWRVCSSAHARRRR